MAHMARRLRTNATVAGHIASPVKEFGLIAPLQRMAEVLRDLARVTSEWLVSLGSRAMRLIKSETTVATAKEVHISGPPALMPPGRRVYAVGDVHGRADLLNRLLDQIHEDVSRGGFEGRPIIIFLGDYIDRGFQSKDVIDVLLG